MRTTFNIDNELMARVRERAKKSGRTITAVIEEALRREVAGDRIETWTFTLDWVVVEGATGEGVDLSDRDALYEIMDGKA